MPKKKKEKKERKVIGPKEELFCRYYSQSGQAFGNATLSYALAFGKDISKRKQYNVCSELGSRLLRKVEIYGRCEEILEETIEEKIVDKELAKVIKQDGNLKVKVAAITEYNRVHGRHTEKHKHEFEGLSSEALADRAAEIIAGIVGDRQGAGDAGPGE